MTKVRNLLASFVLLSAVFATNAVASPIALKIQSGLTTVIVSDNGVVILPSATKSDQNPEVGEVQWTGKVGDWTLNVDLGLGSAFLGAEHMDLSYTVTSTKQTPSAPLMIWLSEINVPRTSLFDVAIGGTNNRTSTRYDTYYSASNSYFSTSSLIASSGVIASPQGSKAFNFDGSGTNSLTHLFSVTQRVTIAASGTLLAGKTRIASGDAALDGTPVPEPSTFLLLMAGMVGVAIFKGRGTKAVSLV